MRPRPDESAARSNPDESRVSRRPEAPRSLESAPAPAEDEGPVIELTEADVDLEPDWIPDFESLANRLHPKRNEDAVLGDILRLKREEKEPPELETVCPEVDEERMAQARAQELKWAEKLADKKVVGVFDGISGRSESYKGIGAVASRIASAAATEALAQMPDDPSTEEAMRAVRTALVKADKAIRRYQDAAVPKGLLAHEEEMRREEVGRMGTTMVVAAESHDYNGKRMLTIGTVGDSRAYAFDEDTGKLTPLTVDQNQIGAMLRRRQITREEYELIMSVKQEYELPDKLRETVRIVTGKGVMDGRSLLTDYVGHGSLRPQNGENIINVDIPPGRRVIVMSDGVHDNLDNEELERLLQEGKTMAEIAALAMARSKLDGKPDDITIVEAGGNLEEAARRRELRIARGGVDDAYPPKSGGAAGAKGSPTKKGFLQRLKGWFGGE